MTIPVAVALAFAAWTLATLLASVGVYRWSRILGGRAQLKDFPADRPQGSDWYRRAMRAHANCIENLSVYAAIVIAIVSTGTAGSVLDGLAVTLMAARVVQTLVHVVTPETNLSVAIRFAFYLAQVVCMSAMIAVVVAATV